MVITAKGLMAAAKVSITERIKCDWPLSQRRPATGDDEREVQQGRGLMVGHVDVWFADTADT
jgi:hypothetical protein